MRNLSDLLADAIANGLTHIALTKMHAKEGMWQASSRFTWSSGYLVEIEPDPELAVAKALQRRAAKAAPESVLPAVASVFD